MESVVADRLDDPLHGDEGLPRSGRQTDHSATFGVFAAEHGAEIVRDRPLVCVQFGSLFRAIDLDVWGRWFVPLPRPGVGQSERLDERCGPAPTRPTSPAVRAHPTPGGSARERQCDRWRSPPGRLRSRSRVHGHTQVPPTARTAGGPAAHLHPLLSGGARHSWTAP